MLISYDDKRKLCELSKEIATILSKYDPQVLTPLHHVKYHSEMLNEELGIVECEPKEVRPMYRCYATDKPIDINECHGCKDQSCPVVTGHVEGPELLGAK